MRKRCDEILSTKDPKHVDILCLYVQFCVDHDGFLLELTNDKQEAVLDYYLPEEICYWIGLSDIAQEGIPPYGFVSIALMFNVSTNCI